LSNFQTYFHPAAIAPVGEPSQTGVDLFVAKDTANCLFCGNCDKL